MVFSQLMEAMKDPVGELPDRFVGLNGYNHIEELVGFDANPDGILVVHCWLSGDEYYY